MPRWWEGTVGVATVVSLALVLVEWGVDRADARTLHDTLASLDFALCGLFLVDFGVRLGRSEARASFLRRNWVELLGSIPLVGPLRAVRIVRLARIVRLFRARRFLSGRVEIPLPRELGNIAVAFVVIWVVSASLLYSAEAGENPRIVDFDDALWLAIATLSTVGYGDAYPVTNFGRLVAIVTMVMGVGVLGALAATLATALLEVRERGRRGLRSYRMTEHLLVLGWNSRSSAALHDFRLDPRYREMPIVVVAELETSPVEDPDIRFVRGNPSRRETLERASAAVADVAMVFASDPTDPRSDHHTALTVLALRRINTKMKIGVELVDSQNHEHLEEVGCDAVIDFGALGAMMLVRGIQDIGVTEVVEDLLSNATGSELYRVRVSEAFVGKTYRELAIAMIDDDVSVIGIERGEQRLLNPDRETVLLDSDHLFVVARDPP